MLNNSSTIHIFEVGKNFLNIDKSCLFSYVDNENVLLEFYSESNAPANCVTDFANGETEICGDTVIIKFTLVRCLGIRGNWKVKVLNLAKQELATIKLFVNLINK
jgi:hypothetical protein